MLSLFLAGVVSALIISIPSFCLFHVQFAPFSSIFRCELRLSILVFFILFICSYKDYHYSHESFCNTVTVWVCAHEWAQPSEARTARFSWSWSFVNFPTWVLGTKLRSSARAVHACLLSHPFRSCLVSIWDMDLWSSDWPDFLTLLLLSLEYWYYKCVLPCLAILVLFMVLVTVTC